MDLDFCENKNENSIQITSGNDEKQKAPDCVCMTIIKRMEELEREIIGYEKLINDLKAEYDAHQRFIMNGSFGQKNLSQSSENMIESPQPSG